MGREQECPSYNLTTVNRETRAIISFGYETVCCGVETVLQYPNSTNPSVVWERQQPIRCGPNILMYTVIVWFILRVCACLQCRRLRFVCGYIDYLHEIARDKLKRLQAAPGTTVQQVGTEVIVRVMCIVCIVCIVSV